MKNTSRMLLVALALLTQAGRSQAADTASGKESRATAAHRRAVLFALEAKPWIDQYVDPQVKAELNRRGWAVGTTEVSGITWPGLKTFNVVVLCRLARDREGKDPGSTLLELKSPLLQRFLESGGGLLLLHDEAYERTHGPTNRFLKPLGAEIIDEQVTDPQHQWRQTDFLQYWFAWTTDLAAGHPITQGLQTLWYPEGHSPSGDRKTCALRLNASWTVLARGMSSAYSIRAAKGPLPQQKSVASAPVLAAARSVDKGRMVLFSSHSTFTLQAGHHTIWQDIVLSRGDGQRASDTGRMLFNALEWLAEPSRQAGSLGGFVEPPPPQHEPAPEAVDKTGKQPDVQAGTFRGLIGAHSKLSVGEGTVAQWAAAARRRGYDFLVFTESFPPLTQEGWKQLQEQCRQASDATLLCVPGIDFRDPRGNRYVSFAFPLWPKDEWLSEGKDRIAKISGFYFGNDWAPLAVVDTMRNPMGPWFLKFYGALSVFSYRPEAGQCRQSDDALTTYLRLMGDQYNSVPVAFHDLRKPADLDAAGGFVNHAWAAQLADVPRAFRHGWYAQPQSAYISEGPRIAAWWIDHPGSHEVASDRPDPPWTLHLDVRSAMPLRTVTVYDGQAVFRRFAASGNAFTRTLSAIHDRQHYFVLVAEDTAGRRAVSPTLRTAQARHSIYMCTDMQNTLEAGSVRDRDGRLFPMGMMGYSVTGWDGFCPGILTPGKDLMPKGLDHVIKGFRGTMSHHLDSERGHEAAVSRLDLPFGCGDCVIMDGDYSSHHVAGQGLVATSQADTHARLISFTQRIYSHNLLLLERETVLKQALRPQGTPVEDCEMLRLGGPEESFANYAYVAADGKLVSGPRPPRGGVAVEDAALPLGGYAAIYPDFYGSACVFPLRSEIAEPGGQLRSEPIHLRLRGARISLGYSLNGQELPAGTRLRQSFLIMRARFGESGSQCFEEVRRSYGLEGPPAYSVAVSTGKLIGSRYTLDLAADEGAAEVDLGAAALATDIPIRVAGLHDQWSAVCLTLPEKKSGSTAASPGALPRRMIGTLDGTAYVTADTTAGPRRLFLGHPVLCDAAGLTLNLLAWDAAGLRVEIHNPSAREIAARLRVHPLLGGGASSVRVPAESSIDVRLPWGGKRIGD